MPKITVLTRPVSVGQAAGYKLRNILRFIKRSLTGQVFDWAVIKYGGHSAVSRSLAVGLKKNSEDFNFNPVLTSGVGETVVVLSGVEALRQAISWKKNGRIKTLVAGPNIMEMPDDFNNLLSDPAIDKVLVPSDMARQIYERLNPKIAGKIIVWYAGVNQEYWSAPINHRNNKKVLVYWKNAPKMLGVYAERALVRYGYEPVRIVFGKYSQHSYRRALRQSDFAIFLSTTETQGLGLAEAWAADVPTLVWNPSIEHYYIKNLITTSAPFLTEQTGRQWKELAELEALLKEPDWLETCQPRKWVLRNMTDQHSAKMLWKIIFGQEEYPQQKIYVGNPSRPYISVTIPTYTYGMKDGGTKFLEQSFDILLKQTFKDFEVVITDDSRNGIVKKLCEKYLGLGLKLRYYRNEKGMGMSGNTNMGIKQAKGELIKILYQDDFLFGSGALKEIAENFSGRWMFTACVHTKDGQNFGKPFYPRYNERIYAGINTLGSPSLLTILNDQPMLLDESLTWVLDCDYYKRMHDRFGDPQILNKICAGIRLSPFQTTNKLSRIHKRKEVNKLIKKYEP